MIHWHDTLPSTNDTAKEAAKDGAAHGTIIAARTQTAGRGRYERGFFSPPGGLYASVILRQESYLLPFSDCLTMTAAVAVCRAIQELCQKDCQIKWVNDIYLDSKKICGILTETGGGESGGWAVVGVGLNITHPTSGFAADLADTAGAIYPHGACCPTPDVFLKLISDYLLSPAPFTEIFTEYKKRLFILGKQITVHPAANAPPYPATAVGLTRCGHLLVETTDGAVAELFSGEVSVRLL